MAGLQKPQTLTEAEYLAMAGASEVKLEFFGGVVYGLDEAPQEGWIEGVVYATAGAHPNHSTIVQNATRALAAPSDARGCRDFNSDQRVNAGGLQLEGVTLLNPTLIVGVLSPSTELRDRKGKMPLYRAIPSVEQILLVDSTEPTVESQRRQGDLWILEEARGLEASIPVLGHPVRLADLYRFIEFPPCPVTMRGSP